MARSERPGVSVARVWTLCYNSLVRLGPCFERRLNAVKTGIHPKVEKTTITCSCGATYPVLSTKKNLRVEVCSNCHPFYTGGAQRVEVGGRIERFNKKYGR